MCGDTYRYNTAANKTMPYFLRAYAIKTLQRLIFFFLYKLLSLLKKDRGVVSLCLPQGFEFSVFLLLSWFQTNTKALSMPYHLT